MHTNQLRRLPALAAVGLAVLAAACSTHPVQALPVQTPSPAPSATVPADPSTSPTQTPKPNPTNTRRHPPTCRGAVEYRINARTGPWSPLCIAVGGILQVRDLGPDGLSVSTPDSVEGAYEGGVHTYRFTTPGTVRFTIDNGHEIRKLAVTVKRTSSQPASACVQARATHTIDATNGGPPWGNVCMKLGGVLRVENLGPGLLTVTPSNAVSCQYEAGIHQCRIVRAGTLKVVTAGSGGVRSLTVVAIS